MEDEEMLEAIRGTIISNLLRYHPVSTAACVVWGGVLWGGHHTDHCGVVWCAVMC